MINENWKVCEILVLSHISAQQFFRNGYLDKFEMMTTK